VAERWTGSRWVLEPTPNPGRYHDLSFDGVSCTSTRACTAVATFLDRAGNSGSLAERWNGRRWTIQPLAKPTARHRKTGRVFITGVSCASATACTAVGIGFLPRAANSISVAEHWNGSRWTLQRTPNPNDTAGSQFNGVSCTSPAACTAVGGSTIPSGSPSSPPTQAPLAERSSAAGWSLEMTPDSAAASGSSLNAVSCSAAGVCIAVGTTPTGIAPVAERWNGRRWSSARTPHLRGASNGLIGVSCAARSACTAVGTSNGRALVERLS
jgi:hypothetical protein